MDLLIAVETKSNQAVEKLCLVNKRGGIDIPC